MTTRSIFPNNVEVQQRDLAYTESSKSAQIRQRTVDDLGTGRVLGLGVTVNTTDGTLIDIAVGRAYAPNGEQVELTASRQGVRLSDYADGATNFVGLVYTEAESTPAAHEFDGTTRNTRVVGVTTAVVYSQAELDALPATLEDHTQIALDRVAIIAEVDAAGVGNDLDAGDITARILIETNLALSGEVDAIEATLPDKLNRDGSNTITGTIVPDATANSHDLGSASQAFDTVFTGNVVGVDAGLGTSVTNIDDFIGTRATLDQVSHVRSTLTRLDPMTRRVLAAVSTQYDLIEQIIDGTRTPQVRHYRQPISTGISGLYDYVTFNASVDASGNWTRDSDSNISIRVGKLYANLGNYVEFVEVEPAGSGTFTAWSTRVYENNNGVITADSATLSGTLAATGIVTSPAGFGHPSETGLPFSNGALGSGIPQGRAYSDMQCIARARYTFDGTGSGSFNHSFGFSATVTELPNTGICTADFSLLGTGATNAAVTATFDTWPARVAVETISGVTLEASHELEVSLQSATALAVRVRPTVLGDSTGLTPVYANFPACSIALAVYGVPL